MRSTIFIASSLSSIVAAQAGTGVGGGVGSGAAGAAPVPVPAPLPAVPAVPAPLPAAGQVGVTGTYQDCISTCQPILAVSAQCGLPVPADANVALNPASYANGAAWGAAGAGWGAAGAAGAAGYGGGFGGAGFGGAGYAGPGAAAGGFNLASYAPTQVNCVCATQSFDLKAAGGACETCLASRNAANPYLDSLATTCGFAIAPAVAANPGAAVPAAPLPVAPVPGAPAPAVPAVPAPLPVVPNAVNTNNGQDKGTDPVAKAGQDWGTGSWGGFPGAPAASPAPAAAPAPAAPAPPSLAQNGAPPFSAASKSVSGALGLVFAGLVASFAFLY
ncbi:hypothetical protein BT63DRAFT_99233 [Microthyrium microscopicum]|uniref:Uncharacterized protein n=1 Tax=Microthyrium microscopicum TaxID=703497 RepID=A0A6A6TXH9_9PEZI|nr:hypothetical protein BT63DRAFT_99233 [Microthyrium microscopicum]